MDHAEAFQAVGGASSDNEQRGYSHYSAECSANNSNPRQRNTVADSRNELFDASTERDDASRRGEDECEIGIGLDTETALATTSSTTQSMYTTQTAFLSSTTATMETLTFLAQLFSTSQTVKRTLQRTTGVLTVSTSPCRALTVFFVI